MEWLDQIQEQQQQTAQPALLVTIDRSNEASTQSQSGDRYQLQAWLVQNIAHYKQHRQGYTALKIDGEPGAETYSEEELQQKAPEFMLQFLAECIHAYNQEPEIHIFLPLALLNQAVDCWTLDNGYGRPSRLGHEYKVVIRCSDRRGRSYRHRPLWERKWQQQQAALKETAASVFLPCDDSDLDDLYDRLTELEDNTDNQNAETGRVGLKMVQAPCTVGGDSVFGAILQFGFPLAVWGRCNLSNITNEAALDPVLQSPLETLVDRVKQARRQCRNQPDDRHIGHHLALLWDDPKFLPPKSA